MALTETVSKSLLLADKGWCRFLPESKYKRPVSLWLSKRSAEINPCNGEAAHRLGLMHAEDGRWEDALSAYKRAIDKGYRRKQIEHHLGLALVNLSRFAEAEIAFHNALQIDPKAYWSYLELGNLLMKTGRYGDAKAMFELGLSVSPQQEDLTDRYRSAKNALTLKQQSNELKEQCLSGRADEQTWKDFTMGSLIPYSATEENLQQLKKYLNQDPHSFGANKSAGWILSYLNRPDEAIDYFKKAGDLKAKEMVQNHLLTETQLAGKQRLKPTFFIIGPHKTGTSSLHDWLCRHPKVVSGLEKEVRYWVDYPHYDLAWYRSHFLPIDQRAGMQTGDATAGTITHPDLAPRLKDAYPDIKLIVLLRDSVDRAFSHYWMHKSKLTETREWEELVDDVLERFPAPPLSFAELESDRFNYLTRSCLLPYIKAWLEVFPAEQFLFVKSDQLFNAPAETVNKILPFLGLSELGEDAVDFPHKNKGKYGNDMSAGTRARLEAWFKPHDQALKEFLTFNPLNTIGAL